MAARTYTDAERAKAKAAYVEHGPREAARRLVASGLEVKPDTISQWARRYGWKRARAVRLDAAIAAFQASNAERRERVKALAGLNAEKALERMYNAKTARDVKFLADAADKAIKNYALLAGEATSRPGAEDDEAAIRRLLERATERIQREAAEHESAPA